MAANAFGAMATSVSVTATPNGQLLVASNPFRRALFITNDSDTVAYVHLSDQNASVVTGAGMRINASGGFLQLSPIAYSGPVCAIVPSTAAGKNVAVQELQGGVSW